MNWKKGRGKLGFLEPLLGSWIAKSDSKMGPVTCTREITRELDNRYVQIKANWITGETEYDELALVGVNPAKEICFWSFTSDGKQSLGKLADVSDIHPEAIGFEAHMPAGLARMAYWPDESDGFYWAVESKTKRGWNRFIEHHYLPKK